MSGREDDLKMLATVEALLSLPDEGLNLTPEYTRRLLTRLHELLPKRPDHRPRDNTGEVVFRLVILGHEPEAAVQIVVQKTGKSVRAVKQAYQRRLQRHKGKFAKVVASVTTNRRQR
jgi:hypothetical protein